MLDLRIVILSLEGRDVVDGPESVGLLRRFVVGFAVFHPPHESAFVVTFALPVLRLLIRKEGRQSGLYELSYL